MTSIATPYTGEFHVLEGINLNLDTVLIAICATREPLIATLRDIEQPSPFIAFRIISCGGDVMVENISQTHAAHPTPN